MSKRCVDGCRYRKKTYFGEYCIYHEEQITNKGRFCSNWAPETWWSKLLKFFFDI
jgi:hypothetical protein